MATSPGRKPKNPKQLRIDDGAPDTISLEVTKRTFCLPHSVPVIVDTGRLAGLLGVDERTVQRWRNEGMPRHGHGRWNLADVFPWILNRITERSKPADGTGEEASVRYQQGRAELMDIDVAKARRQLLTVDEHLAQVARIAQSGIGVCERAPMELFEERDEQDICRRVCDEIRRAIADSAGDVEKDARGVGAPVGAGTKA